MIFICGRTRFSTTESEAHNPSAACVAHALGRDRHRTSKHVAMHGKAGGSTACRIGSMPGWSWRRQATNRTPPLGRHGQR